MKKVLLIFVFVLLIGGIASVCFVFRNEIKQGVPSFDKANISQIFEGYEDGKIIGIMKGEANLDIIQVEKDIYINCENVNKQISDKFFYDNNEKILVYTTGKSIVKVKVNDNTMVVDKEPINFSHTILIEKDNKAYVSLAFVREWDKSIQSTCFDNPNRVVIERLDLDKMVADVNKEKVYVRTGPTKKYKIVTRLNYGEKVIVIQDKEENDFYYVQTESGWLGYISKKDLKNLRIVSSVVKIDINKIKKDSMVSAKKINLVWHQGSSSTIKDLMANAKGVNVISPDWFQLKDETGELTSKANKEYVEWAHQQGLKVWALVNNQFDKDLTHKVLNYTSKRAKIINQLVNSAKEYKIDGINIDFESIGEEDGAAFTQFIRELSVICYREKIVLSIDTYVPSPWTSHYNREELAKAVDYVIIMAYDEHYSGSDESGSVASIGFVEKGITDTLKEVPNEKTIVGLPFYTRIWKEDANGEMLGNSALSMVKAQQILSENKANLAWVEEVGQFYGEYEIEGVIHRIWLEEEKSIEEKMKLCRENKLAGVAGWKIGLEKKEIFAVISKYMK